MNCGTCGKSVETKPTATGNERLPRGWKRKGETIYCDRCWGERYILRAVTIPIASPLSLDWPALREILARCWADSTRLANWAARRLWLAENERKPEDEKLQPAPRLYLYPEARAVCPAMDTQSVCSLLQGVERKYRKARIDVIWRGAASVPNHRYPVPYPIKNQSWSVRYGDDRELILEARLGGARRVLRLRGGYQFRRPRRAVEKLIAGQAVQGELAIYRQRASSGDHRTVIEGRGPGGAPRAPYSVMAKMVMWLPREQAQAGDRIMVLRTALDRFLVAQIEDREEAWVYNADHVRGWIADHNRRLQRLREDHKLERRAQNRAHRKGMEDRREAAVIKQRNRMRSFIQMTSATVAGICRRSGIGTVILDFAIKDYFPNFPWYEFVDYLKTKLDEHGIQMRDLPPTGESEDVVSGLPATAE